MSPTSMSSTINQSNPRPFVVLRAPFNNVLNRADIALHREALENGQEMPIENAMHLHALATHLLARNQHFNIGSKQDDELLKHVDGFVLGFLSAYASSCLVKPIDQVTIDNFNEIVLSLYRQVEKTIDPKSKL